MMRLDGTTFARLAALRTDADREWLERAAESGELAGWPRSRNDAIDAIVQSGALKTYSRDNLADKQDAFLRGALVAIMIRDAGPAMREDARPALRSVGPAQPPSGVTAETKAKWSAYAEQWRSTLVDGDKP